jgi:hypothetical protein
MPAKTKAQKRPLVTSQATPQAGSAHNEEILEAVEKDTGSLINPTAVANTLHRIESPASRQTLLRSIKSNAQAEQVAREYQIARIGDFDPFRLPSAEELARRILQIGSERLLRALLDSLYATFRERKAELDQLLADVYRTITFDRTRGLSSTEVTEGQRVFRNLIGYQDIRILEEANISSIGPLLERLRGNDTALAITTGHTINFSREISVARGNSDAGWLLHEFTHVWQYEQQGAIYAPRALHAQITEGYNYGSSLDWTDDGNGTSLATARRQGKTFGSYNLEQQGTIVKHYYMRLTNGRNVDAWRPFINDIA